jgi:flagellar protein FliO/FliZ
MQVLRALLATSLLGAHVPGALAAPGLRSAESAAARAPLSAEYALEYVLGVVVVMLALGAFAYVLRRMQRVAGGGAGSLRVAASLALGGKERLVLVEAEGERLLLGVGPGGVQLVRRMRGRQADGAGAPPVLAAGSWLARTLNGGVAR